jgi:hypothetical protein
VVFTDWQKADLAAQTAEGDLDGVTVTLSGRLITEAKLDSSSTFFDSDSFLPKLAKSDHIVLQANTALQTYSVSFSAPVENPILHLASDSSILTFNTTNLTRLSGNRDFAVRPGVVTGVWDGKSVVEAEGSVRLDGVYSSFSFTTVYSPGATTSGSRSAGNLSPAPRPNSLLPLLPR